MRTHSLTLMLCLLVSLSLFNGCGGKKYADAEEVLEEYTSIMNEFISELDKAGNAKDVAKAINNYADGMERLMPDMKKMEEKYPELSDSDNPPEELMELQKKTQASAQKFVGSMMKIAPYMNDPEVQKAQERMDAIMRNFGE